MLRHYSGGDIKCACCLETEIMFMALDHIDGGGLAHRVKIFGRVSAGGTSMHAWIVKNDFPVGFQVLCHNCNLAKGF